MTAKLYEQNVYLKECTSQIIRSIQKDDQCLLVLDRTIFAPEGGGQPSDLGTIDESIVEYVYEENNIIYHQVNLMPKNNQVRCQINWSRRFDHMQQHCGEHILAGILFNHYDANNHGFHLGIDYSTLDVDLNHIDSELVDKIEYLSNEIVTSNVAINIQYFDHKDQINLSDFNLRKPLEIEKDIKIVSIGEMDCIACCGTHPGNTGEVGLIKIIKTEKNKNLIRIYFKCGFRALKDYQKKHFLISQINKKYSADENSVLDQLDIESQKMNTLKSDLKRLTAHLNLKEVESLMSGQNPSPLIAKIYEDFDYNALLFISKKLSESTDKIIILASISNLKLIIISQNPAMHLGNLLKDNLPPYKGKGGGSKTFAQASFSSAQNMKDFFAFLNVYIVNNR